MIDSADCQPRADCKSYDERCDFVSIGNFLHPPNVDVVRYLKKDIWPKIKKALPVAKLHIYGAYVPANVKEMHSESEGFLVHGFVGDAFEATNSAKALLAPLRFGAGLKGKLIQAMQAGTPCAMSSIAAEGMFGCMKPNGIVEDTLDEFVAQAVALYSSSSKWETFQKQGFYILKNRFEISLHQSNFLDIIKRLQETLPAHRSQNVIGQMLSHHQFQSTKYMARWIEAKNR
jgi:glycosyltransferase involved in cell wall biosynthesis